GPADMSKRFDRIAWLSLGLKALAAGGPEELTIAALCQRAGKTRGSFYFHFDGIDAYHLALAEHWHVEFTEKVIERVEKQRTARERLDHLNSLAMALDPRVEQGMRRLAAVAPPVAAICQGADQRRIRYLEQLYVESQRFSAEQARVLARVEYAAFVGFQIVSPDASSAEMAELYRGFVALTGRG
ncbi:MAG: TetR/AcrR family transcriptional regulator, partial [Bosea sp. (in: a-proteobacteria)]